jgi:hypothetical protein
MTSPIAGILRVWRSWDSIPKAANATERPIKYSRRLPERRWSILGRSEHLGRDHCSDVSRETLWEHLPCGSLPKPCNSVCVYELSVWRSWDSIPKAANATERPIKYSRRLPERRWSILGRSQHLGRDHCSDVSRETSWEDLRCDRPQKP